MPAAPQSSRNIGSRRTLSAMAIRLRCSAVGRAFGPSRFRRSSASPEVSPCSNGLFDAGAGLVYDLRPFRRFHFHEAVELLGLFLVRDFLADVAQAFLHV